MRWKEIMEFETAQEAAKRSATERRKREQIDNARRAQSDAAKKYQADVSKANDKINSAKADLSSE